MKKKHDKRRLDRPFDPKVLAEAKRIVRDYTVVIEAYAGMGYMGHTVELPEVFGDGKTRNKCLEHTIESTEVTVAFMLEEQRQIEIAEKVMREHRDVLRKLAVSREVV